MPSFVRVLRGCAGALLTALLPAASALAATPPPLGELEGHYEYREGVTLFMVADGDRLVAVLGDGKYPLQATGVDTFMNGGGDAIPFVRDGAGLQSGSGTSTSTARGATSSARSTCGPGTC